MRAYRKSSKYMYGAVPVIHHKRSIHNLSHRNVFSTSMGRLTPILLEEVYPGDDFKISPRTVVRTTTPFLRPIMDNVFADVHFFFVPARLLFDDWEQVFGVAKPSQWTSPSYATVPKLYSVSKGVSVDSIADYLGLPVDMDTSTSNVSVLPFRAYAKVYNDWYRDENLVDEVLIQTGKRSSAETLNNEPFSASNYTGQCAQVAKLHDYFTQALPAPQKGPNVVFGTVAFPSTQVPVTTTDTLSDQSEYWPIAYAYGPQTRSGSGFDFVPFSPSSDIESDSSRTGAYGLAKGTTGNLLGQNFYATGGAGTLGDGFYRSVAPMNLVADIPFTALGSINVNDLRFAVQYQRMLEKDARAGTRYIEYLASHFNVSAGDARLQRSEYLGGKRIPIKILQQTQSSQSSEESPLGQVGAFSVTGDFLGKVHKGFVEHGYILGLMSFRQFHTYSQGVRPLWRRFTKNDFYDPVFAHIGEQPLYTSELYAHTSNWWDRIFGYKPAWEELRSSPNEIHGQLRSAASEGLDIWHLGDNYSSAPVLGAQWITETADNLDRTLSAPSTTIDNFLVDVWFDEVAVRNLPTYGVPGLVDHD